MLSNTVTMATKYSFQHGGLEFNSWGWHLSVSSPSISLISMATFVHLLEWGERKGDRDNVSCLQFKNSHINGPITGKQFKTKFFFYFWKTLVVFGASTPSLEKLSVAFSHVWIRLILPIKRIQHKVGKTRMNLKFIFWTLQKQHQKQPGRNLLRSMLPVDGVGIMEYSHRIFSERLGLRLPLQFIHMCLYKNHKKGYAPILEPNHNHKKLVWMHP